jgi:hypothetical protein
MRMLFKILMPVEVANARMKDGSFGKTVQSILAEQKPETAYFAEEKGMRTAFIVIDLQDPSQIPAVAEPWFLAFNAQVEIHPAMSVDDLNRAGPAMEQAVKTYG